MTDKKLEIAPSILAADFACLGSEAKRAEEAGADYIHVDVMDGHFVPNITIGPDVVKALKKKVSIPLDVHLMISRPDKYADAFINAGADFLTVHAEADHNLRKTIEYIRSKGVKAGPVINPDKPVSLIEEVLDISDIVLIMSVFPGFGGQKFMPEVLEKVKTLCKIRAEKKLDFLIEIDGGINLETIKDAKQAGIDIAVAGTAFYGADDLKQRILDFKNA